MTSGRVGHRTIVIQGDMSWLIRKQESQNSNSGQDSKESKGSKGNKKKVVSAVQNTNKPKQVRNVRKNVKPGYEIFSTISEYTDDNFWKKRFSEYAKGRLPKNCSFNDGTLVHNGRKGINFVRLPDNPKCAATLIAKFLYTYCGIRSENDPMPESSAEQEIDTNNFFETITFKDITNAAKRELLLIDYTMTLKRNLGLDEMARNRLLATITNALASKVLLPEEVTVFQNVIINVENLYIIDNYDFQIMNDRKPVANKNKPRRETIDYGHPSGYYPDMLIPKVNLRPQNPKKKKCKSGKSSIKDVTAIMDDSSSQSVTTQTVSD